MVFHGTTFSGGIAASGSKVGFTSYRFMKAGIEVAVINIRITNNTNAGKMSGKNLC